MRHPEAEIERTDGRQLLLRMGARLKRLLADIAGIPCPNMQSARITFEDELKDDRELAQLRTHLERFQERASEAPMAWKRELRTMCEALSELPGTESTAPFLAGYTDR